MKKKRSEMKYDVDVHPSVRPASFSSSFVRSLSRYYTTECVVMFTPKSQDFVGHSLTLISSYRPPHLLTVTPSRQVKTVTIRGLSLWVHGR